MNREYKHFITSCTGKVVTKRDQDNKVSEGMVC